MPKMLVILPFKYGGERLEPGDKVEMSDSDARLYEHLGKAIPKVTAPRRKRKA